MTICYAGYRQARPLSMFPPGTIAMDEYHPFHRKDKVVVVMGATGTGKSRLSIDLARSFRGEIINADKMQVYKGLDIVTNKVTDEERCGVPHHLLGEIDPDSDFFAEDFRPAALSAVEAIVRRRRLPIIAGGSNSYIEALVGDEGSEFRSRYECSFLWVDVLLPVLYAFVSKRVDQMVEAGLVDEVRNIFDPKADYARGIRRAIGAPEMDGFLRAEATARAGRWATSDAARARLLEAGIDEIKANTRNLCRRQLAKIHRLRSLPGWTLNWLDATEAFQNRGATAKAAWEKLVLVPSIQIVWSFMEDVREEKAVTAVAAPITTSVATAAVALGGAGFPGFFYARK